MKLPVASWKINLLNPIFGLGVFCLCFWLLVFSLLPAPAFASQTAPKESGLGTLGIDPLALIFQLINFGLLFYLLARFVYPPLVKLFDDRRQKIEKALEDAEATTKLRTNLEHERQDILAQAKSQATRIISDATAEAQDRARAILADADATSKAIVARAEADSKARGVKLRTELRRDLRNLVAAATAKVLAGAIDAKVDSRLIDRAISGVPK